MTFYLIFQEHLLMNICNTFFYIIYMEAELQKIEDVHLQFYWKILYYFPN